MWKTFAFHTPFRRSLGGYVLFFSMTPPPPPPPLATWLTQRHCWELDEKERVDIGWKKMGGFWMNIKGWILDESKWVDIGWK